MYEKYIFTFRQCLFDQYKLKDLSVVNFLQELPLVPDFQDRLGCTCAIDVENGSQGLSQRRSEKWFGVTLELN